MARRFKAIHMKCPDPDAIRRKRDFHVREMGELKARLGALWKEDNGRMAVWGNERDLERVRFVRGGKTGNGAVKALIARSVETICGIRRINWVYYPKPEEAVRFADARDSVRLLGNTEPYPGCVGMANTEQKGHTLSIYDMQGSYNFKGYERGRSGMPKTDLTLTRNTTTRHGGWRQHLLRQVFQEAIEAKITEVRFVFPHLFEGENALKRHKIIEAIFREAAEAHGFRVKRDYIHHQKWKEPVLIAEKQSKTV